MSTHIERVLTPHQETFTVTSMLTLHPKPQRPQKRSHFPRCLSEVTCTTPPQHYAGKAGLSPMATADKERSGSALSRTGSPGSVSTCPVYAQSKAWTQHLPYQSDLVFAFAGFPRHFLAKSWLHITQLDPTPHPAPNPMNALLMPGEPANRARGRYSSTGKKRVTRRSFNRI